MEQTMNTQEAASAQQADKKQVQIIVNARPHMVDKGKITFDQVVLLAFPNRSNDPNFEYTVTYSKGPDAKKEGTLTAGHSVEVKDGMIFYVTETNKS
jgi:hypothetical protein